jgi:hypothetical protein
MGEKLPASREKFRNLDSENHAFYLVMHEYAKLLTMLGIHRGRISEREGFTAQKADLVIVAKGRSLLL